MSKLEQNKNEQSEDEQLKDKFEQLPPLTQYSEEIGQLLAISPIRVAVDAFLKNHPELTNEKYGNIEHIRERVLKRFYNYRSDTACVHYKAMKDAEDVMEKMLDNFPFTNPIELIAELLHLYFYPDEFTSMRIRILDQIKKLSEKIRGEDIQSMKAKLVTWEGENVEFTPKPIGHAHANVSENNMSQDEKEKLEEDEENDDENSEK